MGSLVHWARIDVYSRNLGIPLCLFDDDAAPRKCYVFLYPHLLDSGRDWPYPELDKTPILGEKLISFCETFLMPGNRTPSIRIPETVCMLPENRLG